MEDVNIDGLAECMDLLRGAGYARCSMLQQCQHTAQHSSSAWIDLLRSAACPARHGTALPSLRGWSEWSQFAALVSAALGFGIRSGLLCVCVGAVTVCRHSTCSAVAAARTAPTRSCVRAASCCCRSRRHAACTCPLSGELPSQCLVLGAGGAPYASTLQLRSRCSCSTKQARNVSTQRLR
jgi:hypothetical protein